MKRSLILLLILLVIAIVAGAGYWGYQSSKPTLATIQTPPTIPVARSDVTQVVSAPGILVATRDVTLSLSIGGRISKLSVRSGNHVKAGDTLMLLDDKDLRYTLQTAQANLTAAQSAYDAAVARNAHSGDQIIVAKTQLDKARIALQTAQTAYDSVAWRSDVGMTPQSAALQQATVDYQSALANYNLTTSTINDSAVKAAAQTLTQTQVALSQANDQLAKAKLVAPFDGIVIDVLAHEGDAINANAGIIRLSDPKALEARVTVVEEDYPTVQIGQSTELFFDARPEISVTGKTARIAPLRDPGSNPIYPIFISRRISAPVLALTNATTQMANGDLASRANISSHDEFGTLARAFNEMADQVETTVSALRRFASDAAHELNSPLTALRTDLDLALTEERPRAIIERAQSTIKRLEELNRNLLDLSRIEASRENKNTTPIDLVGMVRQLSEAYASQAEQAEITYQIDLLDAPMIIHADAMQIQRAVGNLIENALKFTPPKGTVRVQVSQDENGTTISVSDTGIGIPADDLPQLFNRFHRGRNATSFVGSGLGLAIVKAIAEQNGGQVRAENLATGARFTLRWETM